MCNVVSTASCFKQLRKEESPARFKIWRWAPACEGHNRRTGRIDQQKSRDSDRVRITGHLKRSPKKIARRPRGQSQRSQAQASIRTRRRRSSARQQSHPPTRPTTRTPQSWRPPEWQEHRPIARRDETPSFRRSAHSIPRPRSAAF